MSEKILVVDDEEIIRESLSYVLKKEGYVVEEAVNGKEAYSKIKEETFDLVISDLEMPVMKGTELLEEVKKLNIKTSVIVITAFGSLDTAIKALRSGASDYILKPVEFDELLVKIRRLFEAKDILLENRLLRNEVQRNYDFENIIGKSPAMKNVYQTVKTVAETDTTVLITGKSGTGKELIARALHYNSKRKNKPFIAVNCGAIPENLIESELFGHKKGAFTGAVADKEGFIKAAQGGTLFLDEISELPQMLQVKFLRVLQEREFTPVGTTVALPANVRFIASTNRDLKEEVKAEKFREDLYYRLNVVEINLPVLQERIEDIPLLADHFLNKYRAEMNKNIKGIDPQAIRALMSHKWKGEVRELENVIERAVIFSQGDFIDLKDLPSNFYQQANDSGVLNTGSLEESVRNYERDLIIKSLESNDFNKEKTAEQLRVGLSTLYRKLKELDIKS
jgi:DNA-binding NtrC family response regulator